MEVVIDDHDHDHGTDYSNNKQRTVCAMVHIHHSHLL